jgi:transposase
MEELLNVPDYLRGKILEMHQEGFTPTMIMRRLGCSRPSVYKWINRTHVNESLKCGRPRTARTLANTAVVKQVLKEGKWKPMTLGVLRARVAKRGVKLTKRSLRRLKVQDLNIRGKKGVKKPERAFWTVNRDKRLAVAKERLKLSKQFWSGVVWIDQSEKSRATGATDYQLGQGETKFVPEADRKEEKVHFLIGIGNGWKSPFVSLPLRRAVVRDVDGNAIRPTVATGRRTANPAVNAKKNAANQGETWTYERMKTILSSWLPGLKKATAVVIDNAPSHRQLRGFLESKGVKVLAQSPYSPDLNLVENVHADLKRQAEWAETNQEVLDDLKKAWKAYSPNYFQQTYVESYARRLKAVIENKGFPTKY